MGRSSSFQNIYLVVMTRETPPPLTAKEHDQIQTEKQALKKRMVELLTVI